MNNQQIIEETIQEKQTRQDKNGHDYLLLKLANQEAIFVFPSKIKKEEWDQFKEGEKYEFVITESGIGGKVLTDFVNLDDIIA